MPNPLIPQGSLNRVRGSVTFASFPNLNVTASYLGKEGISLHKNTDVTTQLPQMTGLVNSPEPYVTVLVTIHLIRSQALAKQYEDQQALNSVLGEARIVGDSSAMDDWQILNASILNVQEMKLDGTDASYVVSIGGYLPQNSALWDF